jgi:uncharacterized phiE125 gp8 family phage protein
MNFISLSDAKSFLRVDHDDDDDLISLLIEAGQSHVEAITGLKLDQGAVTMTFPDWLSTSHFTTGPVQSITSISYLDRQGADETLDPDQYALRANGLKAGLRQPAGIRWPDHARDESAITIEVVSGYADGELPAAVRQAALLVLGDLYNFREDTIAERSITPLSLPNGVSTLLANFRV